MHPAAFRLGILIGSALVVGAAAATSPWWRRPDQRPESPQLPVAAQWLKMLPAASAADGASGVLWKARGVSGGTCVSVTYADAQPSKTLERGLAHCFTPGELDRAHTAKPLIVEIAWIRTAGRIGVVVWGHVRGAHARRVTLREGSAEITLPFEHGYFVATLPPTMRVGALPDGGPFEIRAYYGRQHAAVVRLGEGIADGGRGQRQG